MKATCFAGAIAVPRLQKPETLRRGAKTTEVRPDRLQLVFGWSVTSVTPTLVAELAKLCCDWREALRAGLVGAGEFDPGDLRGVWHNVSLDFAIKIYLDFLDPLHHCLWLHRDQLLLVWWKRCSLTSGWAEWATQIDSCGSCSITHCCGRRRISTPSLLRWTTARDCKWDVPGMETLRHGSTTSERSDWPMKRPGTAKGST